VISFNSLIFVSIGYNLNPSEEKRIADQQAECYIPLSPKPSTNSSQDMNSNREDLEESMKEKLRQARIECMEGSLNYMVPICSLNTLVTNDCAREIIRNSNLNLEGEKIFEYAERICSSVKFTQFFATLLSIKKGGDIRSLVDEGISENDLPIQRKLKDSRPFILESQAGNAIKTFDNWDVKSREKFAKNQQLITVPIFTEGEHHELHDWTRIPFIDFSRQDKHKKPKQGGYSEVFIRYLHPSHHNFWERLSLDVRSIS
jgi:hypothetical protein